MADRTLARVTLALLLATLAACGGAAPPTVAAPSPASSSTVPAANAAASAKPAADVKAMGEAKIGDTTKCPVSGDEFVVTEKSPKVELDGKTYYFCCPGCAGKFKKDPPKYLDAK